MKQRLKLLSLVLTLFLICTLFSCANSTDENPNKETSLIDQDNIDITNETPSNETEEQPTDTSVTVGELEFPHLQYGRNHRDCLVIRLDPASMIF